MTFAAAADAIIAQWEAEAPAAEAAHAARAADARLQFLSDMFDDLRAPSVHSFETLIDSVTSPRAARRKRVGKLWMVRSRQLSARHPTPRQEPIDYRAANRVFLRDAAMWRMMEKSRAETEAMRAEFDRIERIA